MPNRLSLQEQKVYDFLKSIAPSGATNAEIGEQTRVQPHQQVFQITRRLVEKGLIRGEQGRYREKEWVFFAHLGLPAEKSELPSPPAVSSPDPKPAVGRRAAALSAADFERLAQTVMSRYFGVHLGHAEMPGIPKNFDLVSRDGAVVGDAKYYTLVGGERLPPAKFSVIAEYVWLLEKTPAKRKFLVFGSQREVPLMWLEKYGCLVEGVEFYFLSDEGELERLK